MLIFAKTDIKAGTELTYDYKFSSFSGEFICECESSNCKKRIVNFNLSKSSGKEIETTDLSSRSKEYDLIMINKTQTPIKMFLKSQSNIH
jgi:hypothetical protein